MPKGRKCVTKCCTRGFPKKVIKDRKGKVKLEKLRARIVCGGVAAELNLKVSGRRNMLGSIAGLFLLVFVMEVFNEVSCVTDHILVFENRQISYST